MSLRPGPRRAASLRRDEPGEDQRVERPVVLAVAPLTRRALQAGVAVVVQAQLEPGVEPSGSGTVRVAIRRAHAALPAFGDGARRVAQPGGRDNPPSGV